MTLKSNAILLAFLALVTTMDSPTMGHALDRLGVPSKLVFLFLFTYRYLHVIADEWQRLTTAARLPRLSPPPTFPPVFPPRPCPTSRDKADLDAVQEAGRRLVRAIAMVFDKYLRADRERTRYSKVI